MAYLYFSNLNKENSASDSSLNMVSAVAPVVFTFESDKSFYDILSGQHILDDVMGAEKSTLLRALRQQVVGNNSINAVIDGEKIAIGFLAGKGSDVDFILATQTKTEDLNASALNQLKAAIKPVGKFYELAFGDSAACYVAINKKSILLSSSLEPLVKVAETEAKKNNFVDYIKENNRFNKNTLANVYVDYNKLPVMLKNILNSTLTGELSIFNKQNTYAALSYNFSSDKLLLNGYTEVEDDQNYFKLFVDQKEQPITIDQLFPDQTANYSIFSVGDYDKWSKDLKKWQKAKKEDAKIAAQHKAINDKYRIDINQTFPQYFDTQFAALQLRSGEKLGIVKIKNGEKLGQLLLDLSSDYAPDIRIFKERNLMYNFFGQPFQKFERPFYTIIDNHFVLASYASTIQVFLNSYKNNRLLATTERYQEFKDQTASTATIAFYINHTNSNNIFGRNLKRPYYRQYRSEKGVKNYNAFGYQLSADNGKFMSNVLLLKNQTKKEIDTDSLNN
jgi:hypothetical protein